MKSEKDLVRERAKQIAEKFAMMGNSRSNDNNGENPVQAKEKRYREYVNKNLVRVESIGHALYGEWIHREESIGLSIHDPLEWLEKRTNAKENATGMFRL